MSEWLPRFPGQINGIIGQNDSLGLGSIDAIRAAELDVRQFAISGVDGTRDGLVAVKAGDMVSVFQDAKAQAQGALDVAIRAVRGDSYQPQSDIWRDYGDALPWGGGTAMLYEIPWTLITAENVDAINEKLLSKQ